MDPGQAAEGLVLLASHITHLSNQWQRLELHEIRNVVRMRSFRELEKLNAKRDAAAVQWRARALELALTFGEEKTSTFKLAERVAEVLAGELHGGGPSANSVYQYLRSQQDGPGRFFKVRKR